ncbi:hypothetical protein Bbelb_094820 [Branchiostoma belcheri]|nr:hypothetical protein Bbelb_094820 [Branchiostoma belcheri]
MAISPSCSRSGLISRECETRPETCIGLSGPTPVASLRSKALRAVPTTLLSTGLTAFLTTAVQRELIETNPTGLVEANGYKAVPGLLSYSGADSFLYRLSSLTAYLTHARWCQPATCHSTHGDLDPQPDRGHRTEPSGRQIGEARRSREHAIKVSSKREVQASLRGVGKSHHYIMLLPQALLLVSSIL